MMLQIKINNLNKKYGKNKVLNNLNLCITNNKYNFIIGTNGVGKSTFIKCINGIINYEGYINNDKYEISYCPDKVHMPDFISLKNFLFLIGKSCNIPSSKLNSKISYYIDKFQVEKYQNTPIIKLSKGTRQKILIIQCFLKEADVYIFDEPLTGLDETSQKLFFEELAKLKDVDKLIMIITHQLSKYPFKDINKIELKND